MKEKTLFELFSPPEVILADKIICLWAEHDLDTYSPSSINPKVNIKRLKPLILRFIEYESIEKSPNIEVVNVFKCLQEELNKPRYNGQANALKSIVYQLAEMVLSGEHLPPINKIQRTELDF